MVFTRAPDLTVDIVRLYRASLREARYDVGVLLLENVNRTGADAYAPMLDWSRLDRISFSSPRQDSRAGGIDLYLIRYR